MPMVLVKKDAVFYPDGSLVERFARALPQLVAEALTVPGTEGELTAEDVEVYVSDFGPLDIHTRQIEITVFANDYPKRRINLGDRRETLINLIRKNRDIRDGSVWILLCPGSYGTF